MSKVDLAKLVGPGRGGTWIWNSDRTDRSEGDPESRETLSTLDISTGSKMVVRQENSGSGHV
jgi:hypothetical protein